MSDKKPIQTVASHIAWECPYYRVRQDAIRLENGNDGVYNVVELPDSVFIVPMLPDKQLVLIRNYRHTLGQWVWEVPAGSIKPEQSPTQAALAELREEVGGSSESLQFITRASTMNGIGTNYAHFFLAHDVQLTHPHHEDTEFMTRHIFPIDTVFDMIHHGKMNDVSSMTALFLAQPFLKR